MSAPRCAAIPRPVLAVLLALSPTTCVWAQAAQDTVSSIEFTKAVIDDVMPRRDTSGEILDAHDGCLYFFAGKYYLYGTRYGDTDGWSKTNSYVVYSSKNLKDWTNDGVVLPHTPRGIYFRPYVIYNRKTSKYVLWHYVNGKIGVGTADRPEGPFAEINNDVPMKYGRVGGTGDLGLFVDDDGTAYITYSFSQNNDAENGYKSYWISKEPIPHHQVVVEQLASDYLSSTGRATRPVAGNVEAPALFRRGKLYYLLFDNTCAFCSAGTGVRVYLARHPLGPFIYKGNINRVSARSRGLASPFTFPSTGRKDAIIKAQQTCVATLPGPDGNQYLWMGDRWGSTADDIKGHDFQYWGLLSFDDDGMIRQLQKRDTWVLEIPTS